MSYPSTVAEQGIKIIRHHDKTYEVPTRLIRWGGVLKEINELGQYVFDENYGMADECCMLVWTKDSRETSGFAGAWPAKLKGGGTPTSGGSHGGSGSGYVSQVGGQFTDPPSQPDANAATFGFRPVQGQAGGNQFGTSPGHGAGFSFQDAPSQPDANSPAHGGFGHPTDGSGSQQGSPAGPEGTNQSGNSTPTGQGHGKCGVMSGKHSMLPLFDNSGKGDDRFKSLDVSFPEGFPKVPKGLYGIAMAGTSEYEQSPIFMPCDPRLFAVNFAGDARMGSQVCDLTEGFEVDKDRTAPLQAVFRVLKKPNGGENSIAIQLGPSGCGDAEGGYVYDRAAGGGGGGGGAGPGSVASGGGGVPVGGGGQDVNTPVPNGGGAGPGSTQTQSNDFVIAQLSVNKGGFIDVGSVDDKHSSGADADGTKINKAHISTKALFRRNKPEDGPLRFEDGYKVGTEFEQPVKVHLAWTGDDWAWYTSSPITSPYFPVNLTPLIPTNTTTTPGNPVTGTSVRTDDIRKPPPTPSIADTILRPPTSPIGAPINPANTNPPGEPTPPAASDTIFNGTTPGGLPFRVEPGSEPTGEPFPPGFFGDLTADTPQAAIFNTAANPFPSTISNGQAFFGISGALASTMSVAQAQSFNAAGAASGKGSLNSPISGAMTAFAAQGGQGAPAGCAGAASMIGNQGDPWAYNTTPDQSRFRTGTASGGWIIHPPETTPADQDDYGMMPPNTTLSTTYLITSPNAFFGAGTPHMAMGGLNSGWSWGMDTATGDLVFRSHGNGVATNGVRFYLGTQNIAWYSGTSYVGSFDHSNTADRTYSFVDMTGNVEMFQVVGFNPNGVVTGVLGTLAWDSANHILYVNNDSATTWVAITGSTGPAGPPGPAGTPVIVTLTGSTVAGNGFKVYGAQKTNGSYTPPTVATPIPDTSFTFTLSQQCMVQLSYSFIWSSASDTLPALNSGLYVDGVYYILDKTFEIQGGGGDTTFNFGHKGVLPIELSAGSHTVSIGATGDARMNVITSATEPATVSALVPTSIEVIIPDPELPSWVDDSQLVSYLTLDPTPLAPMSRQLIAPNPKRVSIIDCGPGVAAVLTGPQDIDTDSSPTFASLSLTSPLSTSSGGTGLATIGSALQVLRVNAAGTGLEYAASAGGASPLTTKGDLYTYAAADARLGVGADGTLLQADSAQATGLKWSTVASLGLPSGTGSSGQFALWSGASTLTGSSVFTYDLSAGAQPTMTITQPAANGTKARILDILGGSHTAAQAESTDVWFRLNRTVEFDGSLLIPMQRAFVVEAPIYAFTSAQTITTAVTVAIAGAPSPGTNATLTNAYALWVQAGIARFDGAISSSSTITSSSLTAGRVVYAGTGGLLSADADFVYNSTNKSVGIGPSVSVGAAETLSVIGTETVASGASATWNAINFQASTCTLTGNTTVATATGFNFVAIGRPTITDGSAVTVTNAASLYVSNSPLQSGSVTITNSYALWVDNGITQLDGIVNTGDSFRAPIGSAAAPTFNFGPGGAATTGLFSLGGTQIGFSVSGTNRMTLASSGLTIIPVASNLASSQIHLRYAGGAHTNAAIGSEFTDVLFDGARTVTWQTGTLPLQRMVVINPETIAFNGTSTCTTAATFAISGAPVAGTNATLTNAYALWVQAGQAQFDGLVKATAGVVVGSSALSTVASSGFLYMPSCAGTPQGTPTTQTGTVPTVIDSITGYQYFYLDGRWTRDRGLTVLEAAHNDLEYRFRALLAEWVKMFGVVPTIPDESVIALAMTQGGGSDNG